MSNAITYIDKRFPAKYSDISCLALIFNFSCKFSNPRTTILYEKNQFKVARA